MNTKDTITISKENYSRFLEWEQQNFQKKTEETVSISEEEYLRILQMESNILGSGATNKILISKEKYEHLISLEPKIAYLESQLNELKRMVFGAKSEKFNASAEDAQQLKMFDFEDQKLVQKPDTEEISYTRTKPSKEKKLRPMRAEIPAHLPRRREVIEPENIVPGATKLGEEITELLEYEPGSIYVRQIVRPKYIVSKTDLATDIRIAELPSLPLPKSNAGSGMLAHVTVSKFVDHLPFYRQAKIFKRQEIRISDSTIGNWFSATCRLLDPLYNTLRREILETNYLMADETPIPVLSKDKPGATHRGYHWVYYDPTRRMAFFDYRESRSREGPEEILENFSGHLQTDGYVAYDNFGKKDRITLLACMAHARRKFDKALKNNNKLAREAMLMFQELYEIESTAREDEMSFVQTKELRQSQAKPILKKLEKWLIEQNRSVLPKSSLGEAISYTLNLWPRLKEYTNDGRFQIDNNLIENSIRPVALGRKNYLFAGSHDGARNAAMMYSFLSCCRLNDIEPFGWLKNTLDKIPDHKANKLHQLLPIKNIDSNS